MMMLLRRRRTCTQATVYLHVRCPQVAKDRGVTQMTRVEKSAEPGASGASATASNFYGTDHEIFPFLELAPKKKKTKTNKKTKNKTQSGRVQIPKNGTKVQCSSKCTLLYFSILHYASLYFVILLCWTSLY